MRELGRQVVDMVADHMTGGGSPGIEGDVAAEVARLRSERVPMAAAGDLASLNGSLIGGVARLPVTLAAAGHTPSR